MKQQMESMPPPMREKMEKMMGGGGRIRDGDQGRDPQGRGLRLPGLHDRHGPGDEDEACDTTLAFPIPEVDRLQAFRVLHGLGRQAWPRARWARACPSSRKR